MMRGYMPKAKSIEWGTPQRLFDSLNREFHFTLDVAASHENAKCERYFTEDDDGLIQSWENERCFMNCPYGKIIGQWVRKAKFEAQHHNALVVGLLPNRTDVAWFHDHVLYDAEVRIMKGRLKFSSAGTATFGSIIVIWSPNVEVRIVACDKLGKIIKPRPVEIQDSLVDVDNEIQESCAKYDW